MEFPTLSISKKKILVIYIHPYTSLITCFDLALVFLPTFYDQNLGFEGPTSCFCSSGGNHVLIKGKGWRKSFAFVLSGF